ncbi:MFS transporter [Aurantimonas sp. Leaf443]|nr:MFS transporter [Aurantimonas sp. Leaf443]KQT85662.1 MFS transporter [Aurantimonas sp. Leaf443]
MSFDIAAQPFFTVVLTFVFGPYFVSELAPDIATGQAAWGATATLAGILVAILSPLTGALSDRAGARKRWIAALAVLKVAALCLLWRAAPGSSLFVAGALIVAAQIAAELSIVLNDAMLPRLVRAGEIGRVSNVAWGLGYLGGLAALVIALVFLAASPGTGRTIAGLPPLFGLDLAAGEGARATAPLAALWYLAFLLPMLWLVPDGRDRAKRTALRPRLRAGLGDLKRTLAALGQRRPLLRFLLARMLYQDGVNALLVLGGAFAAGLFGWSIVESGLFGILLNVAAVFGCLVASRLDARLGSRAVILACLAALTLATLGLVSTRPGSALFGLLDFAPGAGAPAGLFATPAERAYLLFGLLVGLAFGPVQASSRALFATMIPAEESGRWFGLYAFTGRATAFLGTLGVSLVTAFLAGRTDPETAARAGMAVLVLFFAAGAALLVTVPDERRRGG